MLIGKCGAEAYIKDNAAIATPTLLIEEIEWIATKRGENIPTHVATAASMPAQSFEQDDKDDLPF